jgi:hypothetical protein
MTRGFLVAWVLSVLVAGAASADLALPGARFESVSLIRLIAVPERYDGKRIAVSGFAEIEFENMSLCPWRPVAARKDCLWLEIDDGPFEDDSDEQRYLDKERRWQKFHDKAITVYGTFAVKHTGHFGLWSGAIRSIERVHGDHADEEFTND